MQSRFMALYSSETSRVVVVTTDWVAVDLGVDNEGHDEAVQAENFAAVSISSGVQLTRK